MKILVIAVKPSVGKELARVLGATQKSKNYINLFAKTYDLNVIKMFNTGLPVSVHCD